MGRFRRLVRDLAGRNDKELLRLLLAQIGATKGGARLVASLATGEVDGATARERMRDLEHHGDEGRGAFIQEMSRSLTTPMDREDLFRLSRSIDDVLDNLRDFVREFDLFHLTEGANFAPVAEAVVEGVDLLEEGVAYLTEDWGAVARGALSAKKSASSVRRAYDERLAALLDQPLDGYVLKNRELLRRLDVVGLRLNEAADALADGAMKRSH